jgi:hypothetical protein
LIFHYFDAIIFIAIIHFDYTAMPPLMPLLRFHYADTIFDAISPFATPFRLLMPMLTPLPRRHDAIIYYAISSPFTRLYLLPPIAYADADDGAPLR